MIITKQDKTNQKENEGNKTRTKKKVNKTTS